MNQDFGSPTFFNQLPMNPVKKLEKSSLWQTEYLQYKKNKLIAGN